MIFVSQSRSWGDLAYDSDEPVEYTLEIDYDWAELKENSSGSPTIGKEYQNFMKNLETSDDVVADAALLQEQLASQQQEIFSMTEGLYSDSQDPMVSVEEYVKTQEITGEAVVEFKDKLGEDEDTSVNQAADDEEEQRQININAIRADTYGRQ